MTNILKPKETKLRLLVELLKPKETKMINLNKGMLRLKDEVVTTERSTC